MHLPTRISLVVGGLCLLAFVARADNTVYSSDFTGGTLDGPVPGWSWWVGSVSSSSGDANSAADAYPTLAINPNSTGIDSNAAVMEFTQGTGDANIQSAAFDLSSAISQSQPITISFDYYTAGSSGIIVDLQDASGKGLYLATSQSASIGTPSEEITLPSSNNQWNAVSFTLSSDTVSALVATGADTSQLEITIENWLGGGGNTTPVYMDNFSVSASAVPEVAASGLWAALGAAVLGLAAFRTKRRSLA